MTAKTTSTKKYEHRDYHKVKYAELKDKKRSRSYDVQMRASEELSARVSYANKYYNGTYDSGHVHFMRKLYTPVKNNKSALINMSLDTLVSLSKAGIR